MKHFFDREDTLTWSYERFICYYCCRCCSWKTFLNSTKKVDIYCTTRVKKILEQLSRPRFITEFEIRALYFGAT